MARLRTIKPAFFLNDELAALSPLVRLLFIGLWTLADAKGRMEDRPKRIKGSLFPWDDFDIDDALWDLHAAGFIVRYEAGGRECIQIPAFLSHQRPHPSEPTANLPDPSKTGVKKRSREEVLLSKKSDRIDRLDLDLGSLDLGDGDGDGATTALPSSPSPVWRNRGPNPHTLALASNIHVRCDPGTASACARGLCVPTFLLTQWAAQCAGDDPTLSAAYVRAFVSQQVQALPPGPTGDPLKFWRAAWERAHPVKTLSKADQSIAAAQRVLKRMESKEAS